MPALVPLAFELLARLRSAPAFHPAGVLYEGHAELGGAGPLPVGEVECLVRLSKGIGTPRGRADLLGIAIRLLHDPPVDVLCTTAVGGTTWRRLLLRPSRQWSGVTLTSLMPWRAPGGRSLHALVEVTDPRLDSPEPDVLDGRLPTTFALRVVGRDGVVQSGTVVVLRRSDLARPGFDPVLHGPSGWRLAPAWLARIRARAYVGSRAGVRRPGAAGIPGERPGTTKVVER